MKELTNSPREGLLGILMAVGSWQSESYTDDSLSSLSFDYGLDRNEIRENIATQFSRLVRDLHYGNFQPTARITFLEPGGKLQPPSSETQFESYIKKV